MNVVITGGSSGLGEAIGEYYYNQGEEVLTYGKSNGYDLSNHLLREKMIKEFLDPIFPIDLLINNAGVMFLDEEEISMTNMITMVHLNLVAVWDLSTRLYPMLHEGRGQIINIGSVSGVKGDVECPLYAATKAGVINLTKSFAKKYAPHVRVNCISPGFYNTNLVPGPAPKELIKGVPLAREAEPNEIIPVVEYLVQNRYTTGANIITDGGLSVA